MKIWVFGTTSDFSKKIIEKFNDYDVETFGRDNVTYSHPESFFDNINTELPDILIFNVAWFYNDSDHGTWSSELDFTFDLIKKRMLFIGYVFRQIAKKKKCQFCLITSTCTLFKDNSGLSYKLYRANEQQLVYWIANKHPESKFFMYSPHGLNEENLDNHTDAIHELCTEDLAENKEIYGLDQNRICKFFSTNENYTTRL